MIRTFVRRYLFGGLVLATASSIHAQTLETFAGGRVVDNVPALEAPVVPESVAVGPDGAIYVVNGFTHRLMRRDPATSILTIKPHGASSLGTAGPFFFGPNGSAYVVTGISLYRLNLATGQAEAMAEVLKPGIPLCSAPADWDMQFAVDGNGSVYFVDSMHNSICKIFGFNDIRRVAGTDAPGFSGDGGLAEFAQFSAPAGIAIDAGNNIYIADSGNRRIRKISATTGIIATIAGTGAGTITGENLPAVAANLANPTKLAVDGAGNLLVYEANRFRVRRIDAQTGLIATIAGGGPSTGSPPDGGLATETGLGTIADIAVQANGDVLLSDADHLGVRRVAYDTGIINTVIGNGQQYFCGETSAPRDACLHHPRSVAIDSNGDLYISDFNNRRVRKVSGTPAVLTTVAGSSTRIRDSEYVGEGGLATEAKFPSPLRNVSIDAQDNLYIAGETGDRVYRVDKITGIITTVAGSGLRGFAGDGGPATAARTSLPSSVVVDSAGNLYFSDRFNHRIRRVAADTGIITTVAGNGLATGPLGDGGPAIWASLSAPLKVALDNAGNLLIADTEHRRIRKVDRTTGIITTVAGNGSAGSSGDGGPATAAAINLVYSFALDSGGHIFIIDGSRVRRIDAATGIINTVPGVPTTSPEGFSLFLYNDMAFDASGRLYVGTYDAVLRISGLPAAPADSTAPVIQANVSGSVGNDGWYTGDAQVSWSVTDAESSVTSSNGCAATSLTSDTAGTTLTCSATSAGGTANNSVTLKRDTTAPLVSFSAPSPAASAAGWHNTNVAIPFTVSDSLSGVASSTPSPVTITGEGPGLTGSINVTDVAGNSTTITSPGVSIDRTPPLLTFTLPAAGTAYGAFTTPITQYSCSDAVSGIATCTGTLPNGTTIATNTPGNFNFQVSVTDNAGNVTIVSRGFSVAAMVFERWIEPMRRSPTYNGVTAGSLVPIRWRLLDGAGGVVSNPAVFQSITALTFGCQAAVPLIDTATGGPGLSHNPATGVFTYNWQTDASWTGCRRVQLRFSNNYMNELIFRFQ